MVCSNTKKEKRPKVLFGDTHRIRMHRGKLYMVTNYKDGKLFEIFIYAEKTGSHLSSIGEALGRCISTGLRFGIPAEEFVKQLIGIRSSEPVWDNGRQNLSIPDGIAQVIEDIITKQEEKES